MLNAVPRYDRSIETTGRLEFAPSPELADALGRLRAKKGGRVALYSNWFMSLTQVPGGNGVMHSPEQEHELTRYMRGLASVNMRPIRTSLDVSTARSRSGALRVNFPLLPDQQTRTVLVDSDLLQSDTHSNKLIARFDVHRNDLARPSDLQLGIDGLVSLMGLRHPSQSSPSQRARRPETMSHNEVFVMYERIHEEQTGRIIHGVFPRA